ncbi:hypothetical protein HDV05_005180 [Chytridiales sp. JEL 0842]|nr:hypothetical protein HDV05_005180 [Chytridiales sp. JEL 0842]
MMTTGAIPDSPPQTDELTQKNIVDAFAIMENLQRENAELLSRVQHLQEELDETAAECLKYKNKCSVLAEAADGHGSTLSELEVHVSSQTEEIANLRKESRVAQKEKADLQEKLDKETSMFEKMKAEWIQKEKSLLEQLKSQRQENKSLKSQSVLLDKQLQETAVGQSTSESAALNEAKAAHRAAERKVTTLTIELSKLQRQMVDLDTNLKESQNLVSQLRAERDQLTHINATLMEETESYEQLLKERAMNGELLQTSFMSSGSNNDEDAPLGSPSKEMHGFLDNGFENSISSIASSSQSLAAELEGLANESSPMKKSTVSQDDNLKAKIESLEKTIQLQEFCIDKLIKQIERLDVAKTEEQEEMEAQKASKQRRFSLFKTSGGNVPQTIPEEAEEVVMDPMEAAHDAVAVEKPLPVEPAATSNSESRWTFDKLRSARAARPSKPAPVETTVPTSSEEHPNPSSSVLNEDFTSPLTAVPKQVSIPSSLFATSAKKDKEEQGILSNIKRMSFGLFGSKPAAPLWASTQPAETFEVAPAAEGPEMMMVVDAFEPPVIEDEAVQG